MDVELMNKCLYVMRFFYSNTLLKLIPSTNFTTQTNAIKQGMEWYLYVC